MHQWSNTTKAGARTPPWQQVRNPRRSQMRGPTSQSIFLDEGNKYCGLEGFSRSTVSPPNHVKRVVCKSFHFFSLNSQHCQAAVCGARLDLTGQDDYYLLLLQEPFIWGKGCRIRQPKPPFLHRGLSYGQPSTIDVWFCPDFSGRDICTVKWLLGDQDDNKTQRVFIAPMYLDIKTPLDNVFL